MSPKLRVAFLRRGLVLAGAVTVGLLAACQEAAPGNVATSTETVVATEQVAPTEAPSTATAPPASPTAEDTPASNAIRDKGGHGYG